MKLLSINNHSLTYKVTPHCAECVFLLFFVINALGMLRLPVPVHVQPNTNKNVYWAWLLRKSVFVVLGWKGTTQAEKSRYPEQGNTLHRETLDSVLDCASGDNGKALWRSAEPPASSRFHVWFLVYLIPSLALKTSLYNLTSPPPPSPLPAAQWRKFILTEGQRVALALTFCLILTARAQCGRGWAGVDPQKSLCSWLSTSRELLRSPGAVRQPLWQCTLP